jgi:hypothetical protein
VCLGIEQPCGTCDQILLPVWNLRSCIYWAPSLTRGQICNSQCNHSMVRVAQNTQPCFTVSSKSPPTCRARFPYLYPPGTGWPSYTPGHWFGILYFFFHVAPQLHSRGWLDPVLDPTLFLLPGNRTRDLWICSKEQRRSERDREKKKKVVRDTTVCGGVIET